MTDIDPQSPDRPHRCHGAGRVAAGLGQTPLERRLILGVEPHDGVVDAKGDWRAARVARLAELLIVAEALLDIDTAAWLRTPNAALEGRAPISVLIVHADALPRLCFLLQEEAAACA